jgi:endonuclease III
VVATLLTSYGRPEPPPATGVFELILYENLAYLADDEQRAAAFGELRRRVGTTPSTILAAPLPVLVELARAGIMAEAQAAKLRACADVARREFAGDLDALAKKPLREARKALTRFPSIGEPGAEKLLLLTRSHKVLALDSNGLRVLQRVGFGEALKSYAASYRSAQEAASAEAPARFEFLIAAHLLLRRHGKQVCKSGRPRCELCPLAAGCAYAQGARRPA